METTVKKPPFVTEFGGSAIIERGEWLYCIEKNVQILTSALTEAMSLVNKKPVLQKFTVGIQIKGNEHVFLWRDEYNIHIGCLNEPKIVFNKKYQQLIKHLNSK